MTTIPGTLELVLETVVRDSRPDLPQQHGHVPLLRLVLKMLTDPDDMSDPEWVAGTYTIAVWIVGWAFWDGHRFLWRLRVEGGVCRVGMR